MISSLKTNKIEIPQNALFVQTNKAFTWAANDLFNFSAIKVRDIDGLSLANRMEIVNIKSFAQLTANWDGYDAATVNPVAIEKAVSFIHEINNFDIDVYLSSPGPNGEIMVQLKCNRHELECIFYEDKSKYVLFNNNSFENQGEYDPTILPDLLAWLNANE